MKKLNSAKILVLLVIMDANWLPVKEEPFNLCLRIYLPVDQVISGTWEMPLIENREE